MRPCLAVLAVLAALALVLASTAVAPPAGAQEAKSENPTPWVYPRSIKAAGRKVALHEPEVVSYDDETRAVSLRIPIEVTDSLGGTHMGVVAVSGTARLDVPAGLVQIDGITAETLTAAVPSLEKGAELAAALPEAWPKRHVLRLELITARPGQTHADAGIKLKITPPEIIVRRRPSVLVQIDGEPVMQPLGDLPLEYVANSAADLLKNSNGKWFLLLDGYWLKADSLVGPWASPEKLPIALTQLPVDHARGHMRRFIPGTRRFKRRFPDGAPKPPDPLPQVIVRQKPAELVRLLGDPLFMLMPGDKLQVVANTESDLLFHPKSLKYYLLISGRWFTADKIDGPWGANFGNLPPEFAQIPADHVKGHMLSCVPGTPQANEAVARANLRQRATIKKRVRADVRMKGKDPQTAPIEGTTARLVTNSEDDVIGFAGAYYAWADGMWFMSENGKTKYKPVDALPEGMLPLPTSCGLLHVNTTKPLGILENTVSTETTAAAQGVFIHRGAPVFGTGFRRRGLMRNKNWYPCARSFGENRWYDPVSGTFRPRSVLYQDNGSAKATLWSNYTASYGRVSGYANRYRQGGRRMFRYDAPDDSFDTSAKRPKVLMSFTRNENIVALDGILAETVPLGDRTNEPAPEGPAIAVTDDGQAYRKTDGKYEAYTAGKWAPTSEIPKATATWLDVLTEIRGRPEAIRTWAAKRRAPLPATTEITGP